MAKPAPVVRTVGRSSGSIMIQQLGQRNQAPHNNFGTAFDVLASPMASPYMGSMQSPMLCPQSPTHYMPGPMVMARPTTPSVGSRIGCVAPQYQCQSPSHATSGAPMSFSNMPPMMSLPPSIMSSMAPAAGVTQAPPSQSTQARPMLVLPREPVVTTVIEPGSSSPLWTAVAAPNRRSKAKLGFGDVSQSTENLGGAALGPMTLGRRPTVLADGEAVDLYYDRKELFQRNFTADMKQARSFKAKKQTGLATEKRRNQSARDRAKQLSCTTEDFSDDGY